MLFWCWALQVQGRNLDKIWQIFHHFASLFLWFFIFCCRLTWISMWDNRFLLTDFFICGRTIPVQEPWVFHTVFTHICQFFQFLPLTSSLVDHLFFYHCCFSCQIFFFFYSLFLHVIIIRHCFLCFLNIFSPRCSSYPSAVFSEIACVSSPLWDRKQNAKAHLDHTLVFLQRLDPAHFLTI